MNTGKRPSIVVDNRRRSIPTWQERISDPSLTVLLVLQLCAIFVAAPLTVKGLPMARTVADTLVLAVLAIVVMLSQKWGAIIVILLGLAAHVVSFLLTGEWSPVSGTIARHGGEIFAFSALVWVVAHAVYAPGRITLHRLQGAIVLYLNLAVIFAAAYGLIWELIPDAFANIAAPTVDPQEVANMLYFSLTTLTTTGYGDIVPIEPFARSLANLESVIGPLFLAMTVARLVSMELADLCLPIMPSERSADVDRRAKRLMQYARLSAPVDGAEYPCRAQGACAPGCSRSRNSPTDDGGAVPPTPRHGRDTRVGSIRSAVRHARFATVSVA